MRKPRSPQTTKRSRSNLDDFGAKLEVRRHPHARRLTLRVSRTRRAVLVTIPAQCDLDEAGSFLDRHLVWVRERLDSLPLPVPFVDGAVMPLRGEPHRVVVDDAAKMIVTRERKGGKWREIVVPGPAASAAARLRDWLFEEARRDLKERVALHTRRFGLAAKRIAVRDQTSRWGSCSTTGVLSFSWRLVLAPPYVLDYVAAHEAAHLAEMNHGPRFWALVKKMIPEFEVSKTWLKALGSELHRYGAAATRASG